jgi:uncharacterized protein YnzC (UPF0291/DUF896 family)
MQRKNHNTTGFESHFANFIIIKKQFDEHFENSVRHKIEAITVLNTKGNEAYPKAKHRHDPSSLEFRLETLFLTKLSLKTWKEVW